MIQIQTALAHHGEGASHTLSHSVLSMENVIMASIIVGIVIIIYAIKNAK